MKIIKYVLFSLALILIGVGLINVYGSIASKNSHKLNNVKNVDKDVKDKVEEKQIEDKNEEVEVILENDSEMIETSKGMIHKNSVNTNDEGTVSSSSNPKDITVSR